jgi:antitoxin ParD1/3/4
MTTVGVDLPDDLREFVEAEAQRGKFSTPSEYIVALVNAARNKKSEIEVALLAGLESGPAEEWTSQEWRDLEQRVVEKHSKG